MKWLCMLATTLLYCGQKTLDKTSSSSNRQRLTGRVLRNSFVAIVLSFCLRPDCKLYRRELEPMRLQIQPNSLKIQASNLDQNHYNYKCVIIRIYGNNLFPLQQQDQGSRNLEHILSHETPQQDCPVIWIINRIINATEKHRIQNLLKNKLHLVEIAIDHRELLDYQFNPRTALYHLTDINHARTVALDYAYRLRAEWAVLLDGNSFITDEGFHTMMQYLTRQHYSNGKSAAFIPMSRVVEKKSGGMQLHSADTIDHLLHGLSNLQEPYLAFHHKFLTHTQLQNVTLFDSSHGYGKQSKLYTLRQLRDQFSEVVACPIAFDKCALNSWFSGTDEFRTAASECGYVIRMLYWPDRSEKEKKQSTSPFDPEKSNSSRSYLRAVSFSYLMKSIRPFLESMSKI